MRDFFCTPFSAKSAGEEGHGDVVGQGILESPSHQSSQGCCGPVGDGD